MIRWHTVLARLAWAGLFLAGWVQADDEDAPPPRRPGLQVIYESAGKAAAALADDLALAWSAKETPNEPLRVQWTGLLEAERRGEYRFHAWLEGSATLRLNGAVVLQGERTKAGWISSGPVALAGGEAKLDVTFVKGPGKLVFQVYWESSAFGFEPIPARCLSHEPAPTQDLAEPFLRGGRCSACHLVGRKPTLAAPSLRFVADAVRPDWLTAHLASPAGPGRRMPDFGFSPAEVSAVSAFLQAQATAVIRDATPAKPAGKPKAAKAASPSPRDAGQQLFEQIGCLACHQRGAVGADGPFSGGDLSRIAAKRPDDFFAVWLTEPAKRNPHHRMPIFPLEPAEVTQLTTYLRSLGAPKKPARKPVRADASLVEVGRKLVVERRCAQCHEIAGIEPSATRLPLGAKSDGCLGPPAGNRPGYRLSPVERAATLAYLSRSLTNVNTYASQLEDSRWLLRQWGCVGCHPRGADVGLRSVAQALGTTDRKQQATLVPPSLEGVGDKIPDAGLARAVAGEAQRLRPWLAPRMPRFPLTPGQREEVVGYLVAHDRIPNPTPAGVQASAYRLPGTPEQLLAAHRLVGPAGFGCMSCHTFGSYQPVGVAPGARGADLRFLGERIRPEWFVRWMRNPARISPGVEMPAITLPSPQLLDGSVSTQLAALWAGLNSPRFDLPAANAVQVASPREARKTLVIRDVFRLASANPKEADFVPRPFAIGLANGHNLLFDLEQGQWVRWWMGDFAGQFTEGKSWYWMPAGVTVTDFQRTPSLVLRRAGREQTPADNAPFVARLRDWRFESDGVLAWQYTLAFPDAGPATVGVRIGPKGNGWWGTWTVQAPAGWTPTLQLPPAPGSGAAGNFAFFDHDDKPVAADSIAFTRVAESWRAQLSARASQTPVYAANANVSLARPPAKKLAGLPGYDVTRLSLPESPMPTALAISPTGDLLVSCLKGGVYRLTDPNRDGVWDEYETLVDHLAAPYGLLVDGNDLLIAHKPELLRVRDFAKGPARALETVATGWGVTRDYHDWSIGPVRDAGGALVLALPCQQDDRKILQVSNRGQAVRIHPETGSHEILCRGLRFPMGLARSPSGELFATDNQGHANPFNELNHLQVGAHFGFFNKQERRTGTEKVTPPAIAIPHPWSRSVNGVAFLADDRFGPFRGHMIGADYTTRRLIRMSLQQVNGVYQGAAYPFSVEDLTLAERDATFLGPVSLAFDDHGQLFVGSMIDSGWGGGNNRGAIERVRFVGNLPLGIREVRAFAQGFDVDFTSAVDPKVAKDPQWYRIVRYRRVPTGAYDTPDQDRASVAVSQVTLARDLRSARLIVATLRTGFVHEITLGASEVPLHPALAYFTLNIVPTEVPPP